jgi:predicted acetyltransferase
VTLTLRPIRASDEAQVIDAHRTLLADGYTFVPGFQDGMSWADLVAFLDSQRRATEMPPPWVPSTFLLALVAETIVGRTSIRHRLNDRLLLLGGHIGYAVLPEHRRRGYATEILRQSLVIACSFASPVLVTCDEDNIASARTIEACGGVLENVVDDPDGGPRKRRYWIELAPQRCTT